MSRIKTANDFYIGKFFFTVFVAFVAVPALIIIRNENIVRHASNSKTVLVFTNLKKKFSKVALKVIKCDNHVLPATTNERIQI